MVFSHVYCFSPAERRMGPFQLGMPWHPASKHEKSPYLRAKRAKQRIPFYYSAKKPYYTILFTSKQSPEHFFIDPKTPLIKPTCN